MEAKLQKFGNVSVVTIDGELTGTHSNELSDMMMKVLHNSETIIINLSSVKKIDPACTQLLWSVRKTSKFLHKTIKMIGASRLLEGAA